MSSLVPWRDAIGWMENGWPRDAWWRDGGFSKAGLVFGAMIPYAWRSDFGEVDMMTSTRALHAQLLFKSMSF